MWVRGDGERRLPGEMRQEGEVSGREGEKWEEEKISYKKKNCQAVSSHAQKY